MEKKNATDDQKTKAENTGVLISSGLIAGEALMAVILAFIVLGLNLTESTFSLSSMAFFEPSTLLGLLVFAGLVYMLVKIPMKRSMNE
jgi:hypothetical protein